MRSRLQVRRLAEAQDGFTLVELLVVLAILGVVLAGITQLLTSALKSQNDQTNRTQAQQDARLGLDKLRREIRCANGLTTPSGFPASTITITLGSYCPTAGGAAATVTWCTKDKNGVSPPVAGAQPYTLWRYTGSTCSGTGTKWASNLVDKADAPSITAGKIFGAASVPAPSLTAATTGGTLLAGTYSYDVTAVLSSGAEVPGTVASVTIASGLTNKITVSWSAYTGASSYNVYGRDGGGLRLLKNVTAGTSYVDTGPTKLTGNPLTLPSATIASRRHVELQLGREHDRLRRVRHRHLHRDDVDRASPAAPAARRGSTRRACRSTPRRARARPARRCRWCSRST